MCGYACKNLGAIKVFNNLLVVNNGEIYLNNKKLVIIQIHSHHI